MAGINQHHIPQFLQKGFGIKPRSGKPKEIWVYRRDAAPEQKPIKKTAAEDYFYSALSTDGTATLDDMITALESPLAIQVDALRGMAPGTPIDASVAATIVMGLAPRSGHMRSALAAGLQKLAQAAQPVFSDASALEQIAGLNGDAPDDRFNQRIAEIVAENEGLQSAGVPLPVMQRAAFYIAKEKWDETLETVVPAFVSSLGMWGSDAANFAREGHNRALHKMGEASERHEVLTALQWSVEAAPQEGAILPDCVAIAENVDGAHAALLFGEGEKRFVVLPISVTRLLVGRASADDVFEAGSFNCAAAAASQEFFLAQTCSDTLSALAATIGDRTRDLFESTIDGAFRPYRVVEVPPTDPDDEPYLDYSTFREGQPPQLTFSLGLPQSFSDEGIVKKITDSIRVLINALAAHLPLGRLQMITLADDYAGALAAIDRGDPLLRPATTASGEIGIGIASTVTIRSEGLVKGHIVVQAEIGKLLAGENAADRNFAVHTLVNQLARIAYLDLTERSLPGLMLSPLTEARDVLLFPPADTALQAYHAEQISGVFCEAEEVAARYRELLFNALGRLGSIVDPARLAYRYHGDIDLLLSVVMPEIGHVLHFAAALLGHCEASGAPIDWPDRRLTEALRGRDLHYWLITFGNALEAWRSREGRWQSIDEFLAFNLHTERLLWSVGIFPWDGPNGLRLEIPIHRDAEALLAATIAAANVGDPAS